MHKTLQPQGWARPIGYANGVEARGRTVFIGGQIGWNEQQQFETDDFVEQTEQTLKNIVAILAEAGGRPEHIASMTWYFTDKAEYNANLKGIGRAYRDVIGKHFPQWRQCRSSRWSRTGPRSKYRLLPLYRTETAMADRREFSPL